MTLTEIKLNLYKMCLKTDFAMQLKRNKFFICILFYLQPGKCWKGYAIISTWSFKCFLLANNLSYQKCRIIFPFMFWEWGLRFSKHKVSISSTFLRTNFLYESHFSSFYYVHETRKSCQNNIRTKNLYVKCWWNWHQETILE